LAECWLFVGMNQDFKDEFYNAYMKLLGHGRANLGFATHEAIIDWIERYVPDYYKENESRIYTSTTKDYKIIKEKMIKKRQEKEQKLEKKPMVS